MNAPVTQPDLDALIAAAYRDINDANRCQTMGIMPATHQLHRRLREVTAALASERARADAAATELARYIELETIDEAHIAQLEQRIADMQVLHRPKWGANERGGYVICDYDKTEWPCRTEGILSAAPTAEQEAR